MDPSGATEKSTVARRIVLKTRKRHEFDLYIEEDPQEDARYIVCRRRYASGFEFTHSDRIPAVASNAQMQLDEKGNPVSKVYPEEAMIPVSRKKIYKDYQWKKEDNIFRRHDLEWRPAMMLHTFRADTSEYISSSDPWSRFDELMSDGLTKKLEEKYKAFWCQYIGRGDTQRKREKPKQLRWTKEEYSIIVNHLNKVISTSSLRDFVNQIDTDTDQALVATNKYRKGRDPNDGCRTNEAMRRSTASVQARLKPCLVARRFVHGAHRRSPSASLERAAERTPGPLSFLSNRPRS